MSEGFCKVCGVVVEVVDTTDGSGSFHIIRDADGNIYEVHRTDGDDKTPNPDATE